MHSRLKAVFLFLFGIYFAASTLHADWTVPEAISTDLANYQIVSTCYDSTHDRIFAAIVNEDGGFPYYAIYSGGSWSTPAPITTSSPPGSGVSLCYNSQEDQVFAAWADSTDSLARAAIYAGGIGGSWNPEQVLDSSILVQIGVSLCYDSTDNIVFAAWSDGNIVSSHGTPVYTTYAYSMGEGSWAAGAEFINEYSYIEGPLATVSLCYNPADGLVFAAWTDTGEGNTGYYSTYDIGTSMWSGVLTLNSFPNFTINLAYDNGIEQMLAFWADLYNSNQPTFSYYDNGMMAWQTPVAIDSTAVNTGIYGCYDPSTNQMGAIWSDTNNNDEMVYATYDGTSWTVSSPIGSSLAGQGTNGSLSYNASSSQMMAVWANNNSSFPMFALNPSSIPNPLSPPTGLQGAQMTNNFVVVQEWYNSLSWQLSSSGNVASYAIYRDGVQIASVSATTMQYQDHDRPQGVSATYNIYAVDGSGNQSTAATIVVN